MSTSQTIENAIYALVAEYAFSDEDRTEKQIVQTTLANLSQLPNMTVEKIADLCGVSESTYLRFCRKIGYTSFTEFKMRLTDTLQKYLFVNTPFSSREHFTETNFFQRSKQIINRDLDRLEHNLDTQICKETVHLMAKAKKVYIIDLFYSTVRFALHGDLAVTGKEVLFLRPSTNIIKTLKKEKSDTCMAFMIYDGRSRTQDILNAITICHEKKIPVVVMSYVKPFANEHLCDQVLFTGDAESAISSVMIHDLTFQYLSMLYRQFYITTNPLI